MHINNYADKCGMTQFGKEAKQARDLCCQLTQDTKKHLRNTRTTSGPEHLHIFFVTAQAYCFSWSVPMSKELCMSQWSARQILCFYTWMQAACYTELL